MQREFLSLTVRTKGCANMVEKGFFLVGGTVGFTNFGSNA